MLAGRWIVHFRISSSKIHSASRKVIAEFTAVVRNRTPRVGQLQDGDVGNFSPGLSPNIQVSGQPGRSSAAARSPARGALNPRAPGGSSRTGVPGSVNPGRVENETNQSAPIAAGASGRSSPVIRSAPVGPTFTSSRPPTSASSPGILAVPTAIQASGGSSPPTSGGTAKGNLSPTR